MQLDQDLQNQPIQELVWIASQEVPIEIWEQWYQEDRAEPLEYLIQEYRNQKKSQST